MQLIPQHNPLGSFELKARLIHHAKVRAERAMTSKNTPIIEEPINVEDFIFNIKEVK